jgi:hypothetical protein
MTGKNDGVYVIGGGLGPHRLPNCWAPCSWDLIYRPDLNAR